MEQTEHVLFNKRALMNVRFNVAVRTFQTTYAVFHDVDQLQTSLSNDYALRNTPLHMCRCPSLWVGECHAVGETSTGGALILRNSELMEDVELWHINSIRYII